MLSVCLIMTLTACASFGPTKIQELDYPILPPDLRTCFEEVVPAPSRGVLKKAQVITLIADLKLSETEKVDCGERLISFYDGLSD